MFCFNTILIFLFISSVISIGTPILKTIKSKGRYYKLEGRTILTKHSTVDYFAKIPYAKPPIGKLRFKHPQPLDELWAINTTYNSYDQPKSCWQAKIESGFDFVNPAAKLWLPETKLSEDCLYLTIWAPRKASGKKLPVMLWIYGGSFSSGSTTLQVYNGLEFTSRQQVIVVSVQYRLGPLGFMYMDDGESPGNQGLMDQMMGIRWVKEHISQFGGDVNRITLYGESAGSVGVSLQVLSPLSYGRGYFHRAILESGSALGTWAVETKEKSMEKAYQLAKYSKCNGTRLQQLQCMRSASPEILVNNQFQLKDLITQQRFNLFKKQLKFIKTDARRNFEIYFRPIYDNYFIPKPIPELIDDFKNRTSNSGEKFDLIAGFNANEGMYFLIYALSEWMIKDNKVVLPDHFSSDNMIIDADLVPENVAIEMSLHKTQTYEAIRNLILYNYNIPSKSLDWRKWSKYDTINALDALLGDRCFVCPTLEFGRKLLDNNTNSNIRVYFYHFLHHTEAMTMPKWTGAMHGYEIDYVFGMPFIDDFKSRYYGYTDSEKQLSNAMMTYWANFARSGTTEHPTKKVKLNGKEQKWPEFKIGDERLMHLGTQKDIQDKFGQSDKYFQPSKKFRSCRFWSKVMPDIIDAIKKAQSIACSPFAMVISILIILFVNNY